MARVLNVRNESSRCNGASLAGSGAAGGAGAAMTSPVAVHVTVKQQILDWSPTPLRVSASARPHSASVA